MSKFNWTEFNSKPDIIEKLKYCDATLSTLSRKGSSRNVYALNETQVLKIAKNKKGIAQCRVEREIWQDMGSYYGDVLAKLFKSDKYDYWCIMERAIPVKDYDFEKYANYSLRELYDFLIHLDSYSKPSRYKDYKHFIDNDMKNMFMEDTFARNIYDLSLEADMPMGDLGKASSYGKVFRNGEIKIVLIDYGLTWELYDGYYS